MESSSIDLGKPGQIFVSPGLENRITRNADGSVSLNLPVDGEDIPRRRGRCANSSCTGKYDAKDLKRCMRCFDVDYCCRECQVKDWPRHKKAECKRKAKKSGSASKSMSWQALYLKGKEALQHEKFPLAEKYMEQAQQNCDFKFGSLLVDYAKALFGSMDLTKALEAVYRAIEIDPNDVEALILKTKIHVSMKTESQEVGLFHAYATTESFAYRTAQTDLGRKARLEMEQSIAPLRHHLLQEYLTNTVPRLVSSPRDFPLQVKLNKALPFTVTYDNGRAGFIQSKIGEGWSSICQWKPTAYHTAVSYDGSIVLFGGTTENGQLTNEVTLFRKHQLQPQECTGELPPPVQGHSACVVGEEMFVFGGEKDDGEILEDMYVLNLRAWEWSKRSSLQESEDSHRPERVIFATLTPFKEKSILLFGGRRQIAVEHHDYGQSISSEEEMNRMTAENLHVYSLKAKTWKKLICRGTPPSVWGHSAFDIGKHRILFFGGCYNQEIVNTIHIMDTKKMQWTSIEPSLQGIPPGLQMYRDAVWVPDREQLFVYGGRFHRYKILHDVGKHYDGKQDADLSVAYNAELFCFDLRTKIWHRIRQPKHPTSNGKMLFPCGHTMVYLGGKRTAKKGALFLFGGSYIDDRQHRSYNSGVWMFDFDNIGPQF